MTGPPSFHHHQPASDARTVVRAKAALNHWLDERCPAGLFPTDDVLLAVYEALANAAEHAYVTSGSVELGAHYDVVSETLFVVVHDYGRWQPPSTGTQTEMGRHNIRGRGIPLMRALSDDTAVAAGPHGTTVALTWQNSI